MRTFFGKRQRLQSPALVLWMCVLGVAGLGGQPAAPAKPDPDVLLFTDGERLTGHFVKSSGSSLTFKSDALGEITVDWSKVKELQSSAKVAVIPKGVRLRKRADAGDHRAGHAVGARSASAPDWRPAAIDSRSRLRPNYRSGRLPKGAVAPTRILRRLEGDRHHRRRGGECHPRQRVVHRSGRPWCAPYPPRTGWSRATGPA